MKAVLANAVDAVRALAPYESIQTYSFTLPEISKNQDDYTALMVAAYYGYTEIVEVLVQYEAQYSSTTNMNTALMIACRRGHAGCARVLAPVEAGLNNDVGENVVHRAVDYATNPEADADSVRSIPSVRSTRREALAPTRDPLALDYGWDTLSISQQERILEATGDDDEKRRAHIRSYSTMTSATLGTHNSVESEENLSGKAEAPVALPFSSIYQNVRDSTGRLDGGFGSRPLGQSPDEVSRALAEESAICRRTGKDDGMDPGPGAYEEPAITAPLPYSPACMVHVLPYVTSTYGTTSNETSLMYAAYMGVPYLVRLILTYNPSEVGLRSSDEHSETALMKAVRSKSKCLDCVRLLARFEAGMTSGAGNLTARTIASREGFKEAEQLLAPIETIEIGSLFDAVEHDDVAAVKQHLSYLGIDNAGYTPLMIAAFKGNVEISRLIINRSKKNEEEARAAGATTSRRGSDQAKSALGRISSQGFTCLMHLCHPRRLGEVTSPRGPGERESPGPEQQLIQMQSNHIIELMNSLEGDSAPSLKIIGMLLETREAGMRAGAAAGRFRGWTAFMLACRSDLTRTVQAFLRARSKEVGMTVPRGEGHHERHGEGHAPAMLAIHVALRAGSLNAIREILADDYGFEKELRHPLDVLKYSMGLYQDLSVAGPDGHATSVSEDVLVQGFGLVYEGCKARGVLSDEDNRQLVHHARALGVEHQFFPGHEGRDEKSRGKGGTAPKSPKPSSRPSEGERHSRSSSPHAERTVSPEMGRESGRDSEKESERESEKEAEKESERQPERHSERHSERQSEGGPERKSGRESERQSERESERESERTSEREPGGHSRSSERESERDSERNSERDSGRDSGSSGSETKRSVQHQEPIADEAEAEEPATDPITEPAMDGGADATGADPSAMATGSSAEDSPPQPADDARRRTAIQLPPGELESGGGPATLAQLELPEKRFPEDERPAQVADLQDLDVQGLGLNLGDPDDLVLPSSPAPPNSGSPGAQRPSTAQGAQHRKHRKHKSKASAQAGAKSSGDAPAHHKSREGT